MYFLSLIGELAKQPPNNSLIHFLPIASLLLQLSAIIGFQILAWYLTTGQAWFVAYNTEDRTYQNATFTNTTWESWGSPGEYYQETGIDIESEVSHFDQDLQRQICINVNIDLYFILIININGTLLHRF